MKLEDYYTYFLDPNGINLEKLRDSTLKALDALRIWWDGPETRVNSATLKQMKSHLNKLIGKNQFSVGYSKIAEFLGKIFTNIKFNQNNFVNIHPSPFLPSLLASYLVSIQNPNNITESVSPATTKMEQACIEFYKELIGYPAAAWGTLVADGTIGNITALLVARDEKYKDNTTPGKILVGIQGLYKKPPGVILTTANVHYSIEKAMWILGLGTQNLIKVPVAIDERRFQEEKLLDKDRFEIFTGKYPQLNLEIEKFYAHEQEPFSLRPDKESFEYTLKTCTDNDVTIIGIILTAGTTQSGTLENIAELLPLKSKYNLYLHVDATISGYALSIPGVKTKLAGLESADSITIDGHKLGFLSYPCAAILFRKCNYKELIEHTAPYLQNLSPTIEGSRAGSPAAACWLAHIILQKTGYRTLIEHLLTQTKYLARRLKEEQDFQIYHQIDLNTIVFGLNRLNVPRKKINSWNLALAERLNAKTAFYVNRIHNLSDIKVRNIPAEKHSELVNIQGIRVVVMNPYTNEDTIDAFVNELIHQKAKVNP
ncbi:MAG: pyridoxal phosphate-dependent decarboxylase family protein [Candidatus Helarchaeota archaeon]